MNTMDVSGIENLTFSKKLLEFDPEEKRQLGMKVARWAMLGLSIAIPVTLADEAEPTCAESAFRIQTDGTQTLDELADQLNSGQHIPLAGGRGSFKVGLPENNRFRTDSTYQDVMAQANPSLPTDVKLPAGKVITLPVCG